MINLIRQKLSLPFSLPANDLLRDLIYRRLWTSILISSFGAQVTMLALPLTAAVLLHASATQMGMLIFMETLPFVLLSLPSGVWLDRVRKLPVYIVGESLIALGVASVPLAWWMGWLTMSWLYVVGFVIGTVNTTAGTAAQIVLTQIVPRERLVEAYAKNALASSGAEVAGPATAGALIKLMGAPLALLADALLLLTSAAILRGIKIVENRPVREDAHFWRDLKAGLAFVANKPLLIALAVTVGGWQLCFNAALVVQILFATRVLGLSEQAVGLSYMGMGVGTIIASVYGHRISRHLGPGPCMVVGITVCGLGWSMLAMAPANAWGVAAFALMLACFSVGAVLIFINFLALRQSVTPEPMLGRMTSTMRWLILIPAGPGALIGGWLGEHLGLRYSLAFAGGMALLLALLAWRNPIIRAIKVLPTLNKHEETVVR
ncbi:MAG: MFS transporter [Undibacterium sp.]|uniref:MFS transporter n=1 Tax=Undibacterium sp. TaxID=1914977 RepID=UPI00272185F5|nr:MFS transporter [Undibacterium sp.]MDO8653828.1 MFS transporter [Undibacterium sp.]